MNRLLKCKTWPRTKTQCVKKLNQIKKLIEEFITQIKSKGFSMSLKLGLSLEINTSLKEKDDQNK